MAACKGLQFSDLASLRAHKLLTGSGSLRNLPPTEDPFEQHLKRVCLATIISKSTHIVIQDNPHYEDFGLKTDGSESLRPITMTLSPWPANFPTMVSCKCTKGCSRNCSCRKKERPCYIAFRCQGNTANCQWTSSLNDDESSSSDLDD